MQEWLSLITQSVVEPVLRNRRYSAADMAVVVSISWSHGLFSLTFLNWSVRSMSLDDTLYCKHGASVRSRRRHLPGCKSSTDCWSVGSRLYYKVRAVSFNVDLKSTSISIALYWFVASWIPIFPDAPIALPVWSQIFPNVVKLYIRCLILSMSHSTSYFPGSYATRS